MVLDVRLVVARVVVGSGEADGRLLDGKDVSGFSVKYMFKPTIGMSFVWSIRRMESRTWMSQAPEDS